MGCSHSTQVERETTEKSGVIKQLDVSQSDYSSASSASAPVSRLATPQTTLASTDTQMDPEPSTGQNTIDPATVQTETAQPAPVTEEPVVAPELDEPQTQEAREAQEETADPPENEPAAAPVEETPEKEKCQFCYDEESVNGKMLYPCNSCSRRVCDKCIRRVFTNACVDESSMPPRCCYPLNVADAVSVLTAEEVALYKAKYEEWATPNRVYCPVPTCSTFIPPRLFVGDAKSPVETQEKESQVEAIPDPFAVFGTGLKVKFQAPEPASSTETQLPVLSLSPPPRSIPCPQCSTPVCCSCKRLAHEGVTCPSNAGELDTELAAVLKKLRIKQCPKCRAGVRKMFGCNHISCRCGNQWCWRCWQPIETCNYEGCDVDDDDDDEDGEEGSEFNENDLDSGGRNWDDGEHFFGVEPVVQHRDPHDCEHSFSPAESGGRFDGTKACERCWSLVHPVHTAYVEIGDLLTLGHFSEQSNAPGNDSEGEAGSFFCNSCGLVLCSDCRKAEKISVGKKKNAARS
ncbi:hypothetical protein AJ80_03541 [Polytolypa hystricis UAMH7299]|uniref:RBR-type E3 ubiquitin transferase n=1 Tax=Polytolypa hystricis (strain UAMH7299) TaxID=1447883 RepID=A0A2B7YFU6_POLH7|nr:hypothetical protein AJ80_03541 [Polytolypa hystricis UAMH7299]